MPEGLTIFPIYRPAFRLLRLLVLLLVTGCSQEESDPSRLAVADRGSIEERVEAILGEVKRVDAANDAPESPDRRRLTMDLPHWRVTGLFHQSSPILLNVLYSQGRFVRGETYYLRNGKLLLVKVEKWWDVDDPSRAPEPATRQDFYIENDRTIRQVIEVASSPPIARTRDTPQPAAALVERSRSIAQMLVRGVKDATVTNSLEIFPPIELNPK